LKRIISTVVEVSLTCWWCNCASSCNHVPLIA